MFLHKQIISSVFPTSHNISTNHHKTLNYLYNAKKAVVIQDSLF